MVKGSFIAADLSVKTSTFKLSVTCYLHCLLGRFGLCDTENSNRINITG